MVKLVDNNVLHWKAYIKGPVIIFLSRINHLMKEEHIN